MGADGATTVRLCGPLGLELAGREVALPGRQGRLAFAYLVVNRRRAVARDELVELLWPRSLPADPGEALSALLSRVRRAVGADVLIGRRELELVLAPGAWVDLDAAVEGAERAEAALAAGDAQGAWSAAAACGAIAAGGFLAGDDAPWAQERRREVAELRLRALEGGAAAGIALGGARLADAERAAREAIEAAPFRESGHRLLMRALAERGNVAEALRAYEELRVLLRDELGTAPGAEVQELHRRLLTGGAAAEGAPEPAAPEQPAVEERPREERRLVTVLCAELAPPAPTLDPEELRPVEAAARRLAREAVAGFGATAHELGAGSLVAVFGAPVAHEDDAERAVRAGLLICERRIATRAGVASGEAIVALSGPEPGRATGAVTTAAATLQRLAPPGAIAVDDATRAATAGALCFEPIAGGAAAWRATGEAPPASRATRFVGRDRELALLRELHGATLSEHRPQLVTIVGEPGIGKSRLLEELSSRVADETGGAVHRGRCLAYGEGIAYWALREILWDAAGVLLDDSGLTAADKLTQLVDELLGADADETARVASALAASAGLTVLESTLRDAAPESVAEEIGLAWPRFLSALAARRPTVVAIEDLHWAEPALLDMVEGIVARSHGPLLVVATARPELAQARASWGQRRGAWQVALTPLDARAARDLVADMLPGADATVAQRVVEVAEGNPFYAEEIVRHLEHGGGAEPEIPATVRSLLAARIDALPEAEQDVLQHAAVVGRRFWPSALEPRWRDEPLAPILRSLERSGFIVARATSSLPGERELAFVHGLTREVAYRSIPRGARCRVHAAVAAWVEGLVGDRRDEYLDVLAHHYEAAAGPDAALAWPEDSPDAAELRAAAVRTLVEAGEAARRRLSLAQALRYADRALALADGPAERLTAFELRAHSHHAAVHGNQALDAYLQAIDLARVLGDAQATARLRGYATLLCSRYPGSFVGSEWKAHADDLVDRGLAEAGEDGVDFATAALLIGRAWGTWRWRDPIAEDLPRAKRDAERAAQIAEAIGSSLLVSIALEALTWIAFSQGDCEAMALGERHLQAAATLADRFEAHESLNMAVICFVRAGRFDRACEIAAESARQAPGMSAHRALHAVASQAIAWLPGGGFAELVDATSGVEELIAEERDHICANALVALAARTVVLHETGSGAAARAALELFDAVAPPDRPLVRWGPWIVEMQRAAAGLEASVARLAQLEVRYGAGNAVDVLRVELQLRALLGEWDRAAELAARTRALAGSTCAPALGLVADWADAMRLAADGQHERALELGTAATGALARRGESYAAARLMTDLLAGVGGAAPRELVMQTAGRLDEMGARASADAARALAYARGAGA